MGPQSWKFNNIIHQKRSQPETIIEAEAQKTRYQSSLNSSTESVDRRNHMRLEEQRPEKLSENAPTYRDTLRKEKGALVGKSTRA